MSLKSLYRMCSKCDALTAHSGRRCITCGTDFESKRPYAAPANYGGQTDASNRRRLQQASARMSRNRDRLGRIGRGA